MNKLLISLFLLASMALVIQSCSDDPIRGCTDPDSTNYDANATEDDGMCQYDRDAFIGTFIGDFTCPGILTSASTEDLEFMIGEPVDPNDKSGVLVSGLITGLSINGTVSGNTLTVPSQEVNNFPYNGFTVDLEFSGSFVLAGDELDGMLSINIDGGLIQEMDTCNMDAVKQ